MVNERDVWNALKEIVDPEIGANIVDLGLIYEVKVMNGKDIYVKMTLTVPGCPLMNILPAQVEKKLSTLKNVGKIIVQLTFDPPWTTDRMSRKLRDMYGW